MSPGIPDYSGDNTIGLAVWSQGTERAQVGVEVQVQVQYVTETSFDFKFDSTYLRPGWDAKRLMHA